jgi:hypothetical protein
VVLVKLSANASRCSLHSIVPSKLRSYKDDHGPGTTFNSTFSSTRHFRLRILLKKFAASNLASS